MLFESKRSESDIIQKILSETKHGIKKTQLMYNANMSNTQLDRYLVKLIEQQFIEQRNEEDNGTLYYLTPKGEKLDNALKQIFELLENC